MSLKETIKNYAYQLGADLVGFGGIDRCKHIIIGDSHQFFNPMFYMRPAPGSCGWLRRGGYKYMTALRSASYRD
jgi:hypothetical protein